MEPAERSLLDIALLRTFVTISEMGSFTDAARRVHRSASAVSMQVARLEDQLGRALFDRHARHVTLTPDGEAFLAHARDMLRLNDAALARFRRPQVEGRVRFGAPDDFGVRHLPAILGRFAATHPLVEVDVVLSTSRGLARMLEAAEIDMILTVSAETDAAPGEVVHSEPLVWVGAKGGRACARDPLPLALSAPGCPWRAAALSALDARGRRYRIAYTSETGAGQLAAVRADLAIAPIPAGLVDSGLARLADGQGLGGIGTYQLRLQSGPSPGAAAQALAEHVRACFAEDGTGSG